MKINAEFLSEYRKARVYEKRICNRCKVEKTFKLVGRTKDEKQWLYVDDTGKQWNGKVCAACAHRRGKINRYSKDFNGDERPTIRTIGDGRLR